MMKKILPIFIIISILVLSCSSPSDPNNDNSSGGSSTGYIANGIPTMYDGTWKFYNSDSSGNTPVNVTISGGSITGLVISNKTTTQEFDKSKIYSKEKEFDNIYYGGYNGYIVSDGNWVGEIQLPNGSSTGIGYVSIKNSSTGDIIEGILDNNSGTKRGEDLTSVDDIKGTWNSDTKQLVIDAQFVTYSDNGSQILKIPFSFFDTDGNTYGFTGYQIQGLLYDGVSINTHSSSVQKEGNILFQYTENHHHLTIERDANGVPTKVTWLEENKPTFVVPATEFTKS